MAIEEPGANVVRSSEQSAPSQDDADPSSSRRVIKSGELLAGRNELHIEHNGELYLLRRTSNGKLILTK